MICKFCYLDLDESYFRKDPRRKTIWAKCTPCKKQSINLKDKAAYNRINSQQPKYRYKAAIRNAKKRELVWEIELQDFEWLCTLNCYYCTGVFGRTTHHAGLDRIDNSKGYIFSNVVACCRVCNAVKSNVFSLEETVAMINRVKELRGL